MRKATGLLAVLTILGCQRAGADRPAKHDKPPPDPALQLDAHARVLPPIRVQSLALTPIVSTDPPGQDDDLLVLDEAMPKKLVEIKEVAGGSVNNLQLTNRADQPLFLLAGEVIIGGKQDRIIGSNTIIPPKTTQDVPVFCVEHGRWTGESNEFTTAKALAHGRLRGHASFDTQQAVWDEVAAKNEQRKTTTSTGTYRHVAEQEQGGATLDWEKQIDAALAKVDAGDRAKLIGFAVSLNGKVATIDRFSSPKLFGKLQGKLVRSYITEALDVPADAAAKVPTAADVKTFIADAEQAKAEPAYETPAAASELKKGDYAEKAKVIYKKGYMGKSAGKPEPPAKAVYETYQAR
ncbi:MAG: ARPP-1 family domain-containing protein [Acidobacteriota bacterium]